NLKISDMQAACGLAQLNRLDGFVAARRRNFDHLSERLAPCRDLLDLPAATAHAAPSWFGFPLTLRLDAGLDRVNLLQWLDQHKIGTRLLFAGNLTRQPYFAGRPYRVASPLTHTDTAMTHTFWIGLWPGLSEAMLDYAAEQVGLFLGVGL
ncbi:MAG: DegT/DnrJ/EryC1/StrS family aminotransferase, partial [Rhodocyclaceae bacterium]|nr:DegT/DnrJ/EryC1/StrS family aminotransferase [Rhodocyclaceae bacterium]